MKKILLLVLLFINISYFCFGQDDRVRKAEAIQIAYLTKEIGLSPEEAQKFWPVFNNYRSEIRKARAQNSGDVVALEEKVVNIRKKYKTEFKKVIPDEKRVNRVFTAENEFKNMLRKELENRRKGRGNTGNQRPRSKN